MKWLSNFEFNYNDQAEIETSDGKLFVWKKSNSQICVIEMDCQKWECLNEIGGVNVVKVKDGLEFIVILNILYLKIFEYRKP